MSWIHRDTVFHLVGGTRMHSRELGMHDDNVRCVRYNTIQLLIELGDCIRSPIYYIYGAMMKDVRGILRYGLSIFIPSRD